MPKVSLVLRLKNEAEFLPQVLEALEQQSFKDFEIIAIDNGSTDQTVEILNNYQFRLKINVLYLSAEKFSYPSAANFGADKASGKIIGFLSGHSVPIFSDYLATGLSYFADSKVAGVYGDSLPNSNATFTEWLFYTGGKGYHWSKALLAKQRPTVMIRPRLGILGNTNSLIRKDLWQAHHFDERLNLGGEDVEWAKFMVKQGYKIVKEHHMAVKHSHDLSLPRFIKQYFRWWRLYRQALKGE